MHESDGSGDGAQRRLHEHARRRRLAQPLAEREVIRLLHIHIQVRSLGERRNNLVEREMMHCAHVMQLLLELFVGLRALIDLENRVRVGAFQLGLQVALAQRLIVIVTT